jgi:hypothetical protein
MTNEEIVERLNELFKPGTLGFVQKLGCNMDYPCCARLSRGEIVIDCKEPHEASPGVTYSLQRAIDELEDFSRFYNDHFGAGAPAPARPIIKPPSNPLFGSW